MFPHQNLACFYLLPHTCHIHCLSHPRSDHHNNIPWGVYRNHDASHFAVFSSSLLLPASHFQMYSSSHCSRTVGFCGVLIPMICSYPHPCVTSQSVICLWTAVHTNWTLVISPYFNTSLFLTACNCVSSGSKAVCIVGCHFRRVFSLYSRNFRTRLRDEKFIQKLKRMSVPVLQDVRA